MWNWHSVVKTESQHFWNTVKDWCDCQTHPCQQVFSFTAAVKGTERSGWMMQVAVEVLVQSHQPFLLFIRLVHCRKLWTKREKWNLMVSNSKEHDVWSFWHVSFLSFCLPGIQPWAFWFVQEVPELRDANLLYRIAGTFNCLLQGLVGTALVQPLQEPLLAVGHVKKVLSVSGDQDEAELGCGLQVRNVSVEKSCSVELWQADWRPAFTLSKWWGGADKVEDQVQVYVVQELVLFPHQSNQAVARQQDGEHQVFGFGGLQARWHHVPGGTGQRQAGDGAEKKAGVSVQTM